VGTVQEWGWPEPYTHTVHTPYIRTCAQESAAPAARRPRVSFADGPDSDGEGKGDDEGGGPKKSKSERIAEAQVRCVYDAANVCRIYYCFCVTQERSGEGVRLKCLKQHVTDTLKQHLAVMSCRKPLFSACMIRL